MQQAASHHLRRARSNTAGLLCQLHEAYTPGQSVNALKLQCTDMPKTSPINDGMLQLTTVLNVHNGPCSLRRAQ